MVSRRSFLTTTMLASGAFLTRPLSTFAEGPRGENIRAMRPLLDEATDCCLWACWLGHSTVLLRMSGKWVLTDPVLFSTYGISVLGVTLGPRRIAPPALSVDDLPQPDLVLLSHAHMDHMDRQTLRALTDRWPGAIDVVTAVHTADVIEDLPWRSVNELDWGDRAKHHGLEIEGLRVRHNGWRIPGEPCRANGQVRTGRSFNGYKIEAGGVRVVFGGDSAYTTSFGEIRGGTDLAIMPIGAYGGYPDTHCTPEEALGMAEMMNARMIMPIHHSTFRLSDEPLADPMRRLLAAQRRSFTKLAITGLGGTVGMV